MNILADASLPGLSKAFPSPFNLTLYQNIEELKALIINQDILLCRANLKVDQQLLEHSNIQYVATASSGSDNFDYSYLHDQEITPLDAKGCNATAVADYVLSCFAYLEKNQTLQGKKVGIIGLGHVGSQVYKRLNALGFEVIGYDPLKAANNLDFSSCAQEQLYTCDVLCIHAELHHNKAYPSYNLLDEHVLKQLQPHCILINASRGGIVNEHALLNSGLRYCTDVYLNEPDINTEIINYATLCTPHIAGHSIEAKNAAITIISQKLHALFNVPAPQYEIIASSMPLPSEPYKFWYDKILALYNPLIETNYLKNALYTDKAFINLRKKHVNRHDFNSEF